MNTTRGSKSLGMLITLDLMGHFKNDYLKLRNLSEAQSDK